MMLLTACASSLAALRSFRFSLRFLAALLQLFPCGGQLARRVLPALVHLAHAGAQGGQLRLAVGGGGQQQRLLRPQGLRRAGSARRGVGQLPCLCQQAVQLLCQCGALLIDLADALQLGVHLRLQAARPVLRVLHLPLNARDALVIVLHRGVQHGDGAVMLAAGGFQLAHLSPERLRLQIIAPHLLAQFLGGGVGGLQRRFRPLLVGTGALHVGLQFELGGFQVLPAVPATR